MEQDIAIRTMMLTVKQDGEMPDQYQEFIRKYLSLMWGVGFDAGCNYVYARYSKHKTAVIMYNEYYNRIAQYSSVIEASKATGVQDRVIFRALKCHKKTREGHYWTKVYP